MSEMGRVARTTMPNRDANCDMAVRGANGYAALPKRWGYYSYRRHQGRYQQAMRKTGLSKVKGHQIRCLAVQCIVVDESRIFMANVRDR